MRFHDRMRLAGSAHLPGQAALPFVRHRSSTDTKSASILDLRGKIYAFSDPDSNSGWLVPQAELQRGGNDRATFFRKSFFTYAHRRVVDAVAAGVAQGGSVDGYVWDTLQILHPELTQKTRVASKSQEFGFPPLVARCEFACGRVPATSGRIGAHAERAKLASASCTSSIWMVSNLAATNCSAASLPTCICSASRRPCCATSAIATRFRRRSSP